MNRAGAGSMADAVVRGEPDARGSRWIGSRARVPVPLAERAAIVPAAALAHDSSAGVEPRGGWRVRGVQVVFGVTPAAEAGVIPSEASAEASLDVTLTVDRG